MSKSYRPPEPEPCGVIGPAWSFAPSEGHGNAARLEEMNKVMGGAPPNDHAEDRQLDPQRGGDQQKQPAPRVIDADERCGNSPVRRAASGGPVRDEPHALMDRAVRGTRTELPYRAQIEEATNQDLSHVRAYSGAASAAALSDLGAEAAARNNEVAFSTPAPSLELVAHEVAHVLQAGRNGGSSDVAPPGAAVETDADSFAASIVAGEMAGIGPALGSGGLALREDPKANTGTSKPDAPTMTMAEALTVLERADKEVWKKHRAPKVEPQGAQGIGEAGKDGSSLAMRRIEDAIRVLEGRYAVDHDTLIVTAKVGDSGKAEVVTIEDFILFVESVERSYPQATPQQVASEIRAIWFSDQNWELMVASRGIVSGGKRVDIESQGPVAVQYDMAQVAGPKSTNADGTPGGRVKHIKTALGEVEIGHVMAGIDARLSGFQSTFPEEDMARRRKSMPWYVPESTAKNTQKMGYDWIGDAANSGTRCAEVSDLATWAGDIGQAYATFLVERYVNGNEKASLLQVMADTAQPEVLRSDLHGYAAVDAFQAVPKGARVSDGALTISNILRELYLGGIGQKGLKAGFDKRTKDVQTPKTKVAEDAPSPNPDAERTTWIRARSLQFARIWYAKKAYDARTLDRPSNNREEFDEVHAKHEASGSTKTIDVVIKSFLIQLH